MELIEQHEGMGPFKQVKRGCRIDIIKVSLGGGHDASAKALEACLSQRGTEFGFEIQVRIVDCLAVVEEFMDKHLWEKHVGFLDGKAIDRYYNEEVLESTFDTQTVSKFAESLALWMTKEMQNAVQVSFEKFWRQRGAPNICISAIPNNGASMRKALRIVSPASKMITLLTDFEPTITKYVTTWFDSDTGSDQQFWICGTQNAYQAAVSKLCLPPNKVRLVSGMVIHPDFYGVPQRASTLPGKKPRVLVCFGGSASGEFVKNAVNVLRALASVVVVCGKNKRLELELRKEEEERQGNQGIEVIGFTNQMAQLMRSCDVLVGKPGPGVVSEGLHCGLVCVLHSGRVMAQERPVLNFVVENEYGVATDLADTTRFRQDIEKVLSNLDEYKRNVDRYENEAVFEVTDFVISTAVSNPETSFVQHDSIPRSKM